jgi:biotin carboxylase
LLIAVCAPGAERDETISMKALVTMSFCPTSVFVVRQLRSLGFEITAVDSHHKSYASYSNAVKKCIIAPSMQDDPAGFADFVIEELRKEHYDLYFPVFECTYLMAYYQETIRSLTRMVSMPYKTIMEVNNKARLQEIGRKSQVKVIDDTFLPESLDEARILCQSITWPAVIKGRSSCNANGQEIVFDPVDLFTRYQNLVAREGWQNSLPLIQRYIRGSLVSSVVLARQGEKIGSVVFRALHTVPVAGGTGSLRETINNPICDRYDSQLVKELNWTGFISFDYMEDEKNGDLYLIDCNPRLAPGVVLGYFAGVDLIKGYLDIAWDRNPEILLPAAAGIRSRLQFSDFAWLVFSLKEGHLNAKQKWQHICQWLSPGDCHDDIISWRDTGPTNVLLAYLVRNASLLSGPGGGQFFLSHVLFNEQTFQNQIMSE